MDLAGPLTAYPETVHTVTQLAAPAARYANPAIVRVARCARPGRDVSRQVGDIVCQFGNSAGDCAAKPARNSLPQFSGIKGEGGAENHNGQMDVEVSLWERGLIVK